MSREIFLPCVPKMAEVGQWFKFFQRFEDEVEHISVRFGMSHGEALKDMVKNAQGDYLLFCEMDGIIFKPEIVHNYFLLLESGEYDVIGSPRMSCTPNIHSIAQKKFNLDYTGFGDVGPNFWPNMLFIRRDILMQTDLDFANHKWNKGETLLGETLNEDAVGDTMVKMSLKIRELVPKERILEIKQNHIHPNDLEKYKNGTGIFYSDVGYIHIGSISGDPFIPQSPMEELESSKRIAWSELCGGTVDKTHVSSEHVEEWKDAFCHLLRI